MKARQTDRIGEILGYYEEEGKPYKRIIEECPRCGGSGHHSYCTMYGTVCFTCDGSGIVVAGNRVYTEKEQARLDKAKATRQAKADALRVIALAEQESSRIANELKQAAKEAAIEAAFIASRKHGYVGKVGEKISLPVTVARMGQFRRPVYGASWKVETVSVYTFESEQGQLVWKTVSHTGEIDLNAKYNLTGTVKAHTVYDENEQTELIRVKLQEI
jgi:hypothetical protein